MFYNVLDKPRQDILPMLAKYKEHFYLAGGTGLALQIGHRESTDFDFFSPSQFNPEELLLDLQQNLRAYKLVAIEQEKNTLTVVIDPGIRVSFFYYPYSLLAPCLEDENLRIASIADIGCMKLGAVISRSINKDYVDLYYILKQITLLGLLETSAKKLPSLDKNLILKSLVYFDDMLVEPLVFLPGKEIPMQTVKDFLVQEVKKLSVV